LAVRRREADALILEGADLYEIDRVLEDFGFPMGPFRMSDLAGLDLGWSKETSTGATIKERLCEHARKGQKTRAGYYDYDDAGKPKRSPAVTEIVARFVQEKGIQPRAVNSDDIIRRLLHPMVNEAAKILAEKKALRGSDIDVVWLNGYGWPSWTGGPLYWADQIGLPSIVASLQERLKQAGDAYQPAPLLIDLAKSGRALHKVVNDTLQ
jgi:3-hydroxyacyl-CoA dehydrogenase